MIERRTVLKLGAASIAGALVDAPTHAFRATPALARGALCRAVFDDRFEECLTFAGEMKGRGIATSAIQGEVARLWYEDLRAQLRRDRAPFAGLTDRVTLFCLEELARDVGMTVFFRVDHLVDTSGHVQHDATGPASFVGATRTLAGESGFGQRIATLACRCEVSGPREVAAQKRTGPFAPNNTIALASWVFA